MQLPGQGGREVAVDFFCSVKIRERLKQEGLERAEREAKLDTFVAPNY